MTTNSLRRGAVLALALSTSAPLTTMAASSAASSHPPTQRFTLSSTTIHGVDKPIRIIANGPISGHGTVTAPHQASRHDHLTLHFAKGTLTISISETSFAAHPNYRTCTAQETGAGTFTITTGTGSFHGATGAGTFNRHTTMIGTRTPNGACAGKNTPPKTIQTTSTLIGKVTIPTN